MPPNVVAQPTPKKCLLFLSFLLYIAAPEGLKNPLKFCFLSRRAGALGVLVAAKQKKQAQTPAKSGTNVNDVLIKALDVFYDLANSGKILALLLLVAAIVIVILAFRMPTDNIDGYIKEIFTFLRSPGYPFALCLGLLSFSIAINFVQWRIYSREISRLSGQRKEIVHGLEQNKLQQLEVHNTSEFSLDGET